MTQEEKQLLLIDLCARLPYGVFINTAKGDGTLDTIQVCCNNDVICSSEKGHEIIDCVKPYLRPLSSMTEEENKEYAEIVVKSQDCSYVNNESATTMVNDWYLSKRFDVRGLIPKGLALEAPMDMYKTE